MKKMRIFLDSDEVLMDFMAPMISKYNDTYNGNLTMEQITTWDLKESVPPEHDIYQFMEEPHFFRDLKPFPETARILQQLIDDGHDVFISTAGWEEVVQDKYDSFKQHFPFFPFEQILIVKRKDVLAGDIMLDDGMHNINASSCTYPVIMDKPWNQEGKGLRVTNLDEFYTLVCRLANEKIEERM